MIDGNRPLSNSRREAFAQNLAQGMSAENAYAEAGYKAHRQNAARLMTDDYITARIAFLQAQAAERTVTTAEKITIELEVARVLAREKRDPKAMIAASMGKAKLNGLLVDKQVVGLKNINDMNERELRALLGDV